MADASRFAAIDCPSPAPAGIPPSAVVAVVIGNWLEFYDFLVFTFFAVMIGDAFFPGQSDIARLLGALATFGVGFFTRPIGAAVIGAYSDRKGRRPALTLTLILMAIASALVAVTPTYAQIGLAAPVVLVMARLLQGFSCGGEVGPATTYLLESVPVHRRAAITAWQAYSQQFAIFLGSLVGVVLTTTLTGDQMRAWGWRVPFVVGLAIVPVAFYIRRRLPETLAGGTRHETTGAVFAALGRHHWRSMTLVALIITGGTITTYIFNYMTTYAITALHLSAAVGTTLTLTGSVAAIAGVAVGVWLDRFGRKAMLVATRVVLIALLYPAYVVLTAPRTDPITIVAINMLLNFVFSTGMGALYAFISEAFPRALRSTGLAVPYAVAVTIFGGTTQFVVAWLIDRTGSAMVPAWYQIAATLVAIVAVVLLTPHDEVLAERRSVVGSR